METYSDRPNPSQVPGKNYRLIFIILVFCVVVMVAGLFWLKRNSKLSSGQNRFTPVENTSKVVQSVPPAVDPFPHDKDRDGISDVEEKKVGTSDLEFDTDHDGLSDSYEIQLWHTNPAKADTDGDGFPDGAEVMNGYNPNGTGKLK